MNEIDQWLTQARADLQAAQDLKALDAIKVQYLGKKGLITEQLKRLADLPADARREAGQLINQARDALVAELEQTRAHLEQREVERQLAQERLDVTLPGRGAGSGTRHPVSRTLERIEQLFHSLGYQVAQGPEIETDYYNFEALNIPAHHPARAMHDTFYLDAHTLLRTHTSPVQIRAMLASQPPLRLIAPGRVSARLGPHAHAHVSSGRRSGGG